MSIQLVLPTQQVFENIISIEINKKDDLNKKENKINKMRIQCFFNNDPAFINNGEYMNKETNKETFTNGEYMNEKTNQKAFANTDKEAFTNDGVYLLKKDGCILFSGTLACMAGPDSLGLYVCMFVSNDEHSTESQAITASANPPATTTATVASTNPPAATTAVASANPPATAVASANPPVADITPHVFDKSLKFAEKILPAHFDVTLQADWIQHNEGIFDFGDRISALFPEGIINSLNATFGECVAQTHKSGYTIMDSSFEQTSPPSTGVLDVYPIQMPSISVGGALKSLPRYWFRAKWRLAWEYEQKRVEKLSFQLPFCPSGEGGEPLHLKVQDLDQVASCYERRATLGPLWNQIAYHAFASFKKDIYGKYKSIVRCSVLFDIGVKLHLQQVVEITYERNHIIGEVCEITCVQEGVAKQYANIAIAVVPPWLQAWMDSPHALEKIEEVCAIEGLTEEELTESSGLADVAIENDAETQFNKISSNLAQFSTMQELQAFLSKHSTRIFVRLKDLKTKRHLVHLLKARINTQFYSST
ncbi:MAG: hypothetical protein LBQ43_03700 [Holosporales bacterium]|jgi:hypothetical protein|nr:hypothetical protein [Holosporales bacterium]